MTMPSIAHMTGAADPAHRRVSVHLIPVVTAAAPPEPRVVTVPDVMVPLLRRCNIVTPQFGMLTTGYVDRQCAKANLSIAERMQIKGALRACGLLTAGRPILDR
jgi:hypothetical protein